VGKSQASVDIQLLGLPGLYHRYAIGTFNTCSRGQPDKYINILATIIPSIEILGPIIRSRAQQLNHQVISFLCSSVYNNESRLLPNDLIVLRNQVEDHGGQMEHQEGAGEPRRHAREGGKPIQFGIAEFESNSESRITSYSN
jgi:hypothetical protein